jgi:predicted house-cleaning noncanonical NTP pyrophosphatase (MazG superfamily)
MNANKAERLTERLQAESSGVQNLSGQNTITRGFRGGPARMVLRPNRSVVIVTELGLTELAPKDVTVERTGQKAVGLLTAPPSWTLPFFVVSDGALTGSLSGGLKPLLDEAARRSGVSPTKVMVRSNGVQEGLNERGALASLACSWNEVEQTLVTLRAKALEVTSSATHWVIQNQVTSHAKGQMSNERRVRYEKRDWAIEIEALNGKSADQFSIAVRRWRDGQDVTETPLVCETPLKISLVLKRVAMWAVQDSRRFLFEWVWDGSVIHLVQMDLATTSGGENPKDLLPPSVSTVPPEPLKIVSVATSEHKKKLRKLANAALYEELGYSMPPFYVLDQQDDLRRLLTDGKLSPELVLDLETLTRRPLVLRTDGGDLPDDKREMMPRSEELRSGGAAAHWLVETFRPAILGLGLDSNSIALVGHHFIPSVASAWAGAEPGKRWVRIEALWGIPESLYWHSHDTFEVDAEKADVASPYSTECDYPIRHRERFKGTFIAPNIDGAWIHHQTKQPFDWSSTINSHQWLCEIAHTTRRISERLQKPVEVMWFVDNHRDATNHRILPWYHSIPDNTDFPVRAPRKKVKSSQERSIRNRQDWIELQKDVDGSTRIERIIVEPDDPDLIRNPAFAEELGSVAARHGIVIVLAGGILSHAYHALRRVGASVECVDLFGATEEKAEYNKLVRDKVPAQIADRGEHFEMVRLEGEAMVIALRRKLLEEALEALDASTGTDLVAELADVQEVVKAIAKAIQVSPQQLEEERLRKLKKRGGFEEAYMLLRTASPHSLGKAPSPEFLIAASESVPVRTISDPADVPQKAVYKKPDHRNLSHSTEELLVVETELSRLGTLVESINFELPSNVDAQQYTSLIELSRIGAELRAAVRLRRRKRDSDNDAQMAFIFAGATNGRDGK